MRCRTSIEVGVFIDHILISSTTVSHFIIIISMRQSQAQQKLQNSCIILQPISERQSHHFSCDCKLCSSYQTKQLKKILESQEQAMTADLTMRKNAQFIPSYLEVVLKHLLPPSNKIVKRGIELWIPQVCFFQNGEAANFYYNRDVDDYHLTRLKYEKINHTNMLKLFNQRRKIYRERAKKSLSLDFEESKKETSKISWKRKLNQPKLKSDNLNCLILRFIDGCQTMLTEIDFFHLMNKRKLDPFWKRVYSIKNYYHPYYSNNQDKYIFNVPYDKQKIVYANLKERALQLMSTYSQREVPNSERYISDADQASYCQRLKERSSMECAYYMVYKIVGFLATFADEEIVKAKFTILINQIGKCYLMQVRDLSMKSLLKYDWTQDKFIQMTNKRQFDRYHKKQLKVTEETIQKSTVIESLMASQYETLKKNYGVTVQLKEDENEKLNNQFFQSIYPNLKQDLSELVKIDMPFLQFKRKYLGQKIQRKSLYRPFNSKFVRQLHKLTPGHRHSLVHPPQSNRDIPISWRKQNSVSLWKTISH